MIEVGIEYSGDKDGSLLIFLRKEVSRAYLEEFGDKMLANFRNVSEKESWEPLYLPYEYRLRELTNPLSDYPKPEVMKKQLSLFYD
jgi:hypothetical protein